MISVRHNVVLCALWALFSLSVCLGLVGSYNPFTAFVPCLDQDIYSACGQSLLYGHEPYREVWDHKGPLLYFVYALGTLITGPSRYGVILLFLFAQTVAIIFSYKIAKTYASELGACVVTVSLYTIFASGFSCNPSELIVPFQLITLYQILQKNNHNRIGFWGGIGSSVAIWTKFNISVYWAPLLIWLFYRCVRDDSWRKGFLLFFSFLAGFSLVTIPVIIYFVSVDSLRDLFDSYFYFNLAYAGQGESIIFANPVVVLSGALASNGLLRNFLWRFGPTFAFVFSSLIYCGGFLLFLIRGFRTRKRGAEISLAILFSLFGTLLAVFGGIYNFGHYYASFIPFQIILLSLLYRFFFDRKNDSNERKFVQYVFLVISSIVCFLYAHHRYESEWKQANESGRELLSEFVRVTSGNKNYLLLDGVPTFFYNALGVLPPICHFYQPAVSRSISDHFYIEATQAIRFRSTEYVVLGRETSEWEMFMDSGYEYVGAVGGKYRVFRRRNRLEEVES